MVISDRNRDFYLRTVENRSPIGGRFAEVQRIGSSGGGGAFSLLFEATDLQSRTRVALKFYHPDMLRDTYRWQCFQREASLLERLVGQPDIIGFIAPLSDFVVSVPSGDAVLEIVFAYYALDLAASDVSAALATNAWGPEQCLLAFRAMCRAIQRLHARQITHRDLKPENFLIMPDRSVKLSDLGTARGLDGLAPAILSAYSFPPGDMRYAAPEMLACLHDDEPGIAYHADRFALGAILFQMFSGTILGTQVYDPQFVSDLLQVMREVKPGQRRQLFEKIISTIAAARPLPSIKDYATGLPAPFLQRVDVLYRSLAALDYRERLSDFARVFRHIEMCRLAFRKEEELRRRQARKVHRRENALTRRSSSGVAL